MNMKIKVNETNTGYVTMHVCKSNDGKPFLNTECERVYNELCSGSGESIYHQFSSKNGYRIRVFKLDNYCYITFAFVINNKSEHIVIQELEIEHEDDAISIAKFFTKNYSQLTKLAHSSADVIEADLEEGHDA